MSKMVMVKKVIQNPDVEKAGMKHKLWYNKTQNFAYTQIVGVLGMSEVSRLFSMMDEVFAGKEAHNLLIDVRLSKGLLSQKEIRDSFKRKSLDVGLDRIAVLGTTHVNRMTLKILLSVLGKRHVSRFCDTEKEALTWFKEK